MCSVLKWKVLIVLVGVPTTEKMTRIQCTALDLGTGLLLGTVMSQLLQEGQGQVLQEVRKETSPPSARVAAMRSMQQQNHKTKLN